MSEANLLDNRLTPSEGLARNQASFNSVPAILRFRIIQIGTILTDVESRGQELIPFK